MSALPPGSNRVVAMIAALLVKVKVAAIALKVIVGHAKDHRAAIDRTNPGRIRVSAKGHRVVIGHINHGRVKVSAKDHRAVIDRISHGRIKVSAPIAPKASAKGHGHRATHNSSLGHHVAKVSALWHHRVLTVLVMTNIRCHRRRRPAVRQVIKTPCGAGAGG